MNFDQVVRFALASKKALARAGTDNRVRPLIELAWDDWGPFVDSCRRDVMFSLSADLDGPVLEMQLYGCLVRPKPDTIPASAAFGAALSVLPNLSHAAGCYTAIQVTAATGADPRVKL